MMSDKLAMTVQSATADDREQNWRRHREQWKQSGVSQATYCKQHQLTYHQFVYWNAKLKKNAQPSETSTPLKSNGFVGLSVKQISSDGLMITLPSGIRINGIDSHTVALLSDVIDAL